MLPFAACDDTQAWCKYSPDCEHNNVKISCPKYCKQCKGSKEAVATGKEHLI